MKSERETENQDKVKATSEKTKGGEEDLKGTSIGFDANMGETDELSAASIKEDDGGRHKGKKREKKRKKKRTPQKGGEKKVYFPH